MWGCYFTVVGKDGEGGYCVNEIFYFRRDKTAKRVLVDITCKKYI